MSARLFAFDLDGTLLDADLRVTDRARMALEQLADAGHHVVLASGRPYHLVGDVVAALGGAAHWGVMANGAVLVDYRSGTVVERLGTPRTKVLELVAELRSTDPGLGFALSIDDTFVYEPGFMARMDGNPMGEEVADLAEVTGEVAIKLWVFHRDLRERALLLELRARLGEALVLGHTGLDAVEVGWTLIDKGTGVERLANRLGVDASQVVAFGDNLNDHSMLAWAGHGVAMANADAATRALADEIAPSHAADGVATVVERMLRTLAAG